MNFRVFITSSILFSILFVSCANNKTEVELEDPLEKKRLIDNKIQDYSNEILASSKFISKIPDRKYRHHLSLLKGFTEIDSLANIYALRKITSKKDFESLVKEGANNVYGIALTEYNPDLDKLNLGVFRNLELVRINRINKIPQSIYNLKRLRVLDISLNNNAPDTLDQKIGKLKNLEVLKIRSDHISISNRVSKLTQLRKVILFNELEESSYSNIFDIPNLKYLWIVAPESEYLNGISRLNQLHFLHTNQLIDEVGKLNVGVMIVDGSRVKSFPQEIQNMKKLIGLAIHNNSNFEFAPEVFTKIPNLKLLRFRNCSSLKTLPEPYGKLTDLEHLSISSCNSFGTLEAYMSPLDNITEVIR